MSSKYLLILQREYYNLLFCFLRNQDGQIHIENTAHAGRMSVIGNLWIGMRLFYNKIFGPWAWGKSSSDFSGYLPTYTYVF